MPSNDIHPVTYHFPSPSRHTRSLAPIHITSIHPVRPPSPFVSYGSPSERHHALASVLPFAGALGALYGPLHGGANEAVLRMLERIGSVDNVPAFIEGVKQRQVTDVTVWAREDGRNPSGTEWRGRGCGVGPSRASSDVEERATDPCSQEKLFGFGHRVYKNYDPRAKIIRKVADQASHAPTVASLVPRAMSCLITDVAIPVPHPSAGVRYRGRGPPHRGG